MDELDTLVINVRADTRGFVRDVGDIRAQLEGPLAGGVDSAGRAIETALARAARSGKLGFDDLRRVALSALADIAAQAVRSNLSSLLGGGGGGLLSSLGNVVTGLLGLPGRATGGPVTGGRAYMVGERGPELFVPTSSGSIKPASGSGRGGVSVTVNVAAPREAGGAFMARTGTQVARAVRSALERAER